MAEIPKMHVKNKGTDQTAPLLFLQQSQIF